MSGSAHRIEKLAGRTQRGSPGTEDSRLGRETWNTKADPEGGAQDLEAEVMRVSERWRRNLGSFLWHHCLCRVPT